MLEKTAPQLFSPAIIENLEFIDRLQATLARRKNQDQITELLLNRLDAYHGPTLRHTRYVEATVSHFGQYLGLAESELSWLGEGSRLHDIGKLVIPENVLNRNGSQAIVEAEQRVLNRHGYFTAEILMYLSYPPDLALLAALHGADYQDAVHIPGQHLGPYFAPSIIRICDNWAAAHDPEREYKLSLPSSGAPLLKCLEKPGMVQAEVAEQFESFLHIFPDQEVRQSIWAY